MRKRLKTTKNKLEKHILLQRVKILKEHIIDKLKESRAAKIWKVAELIKNNVDNGGKIWEVKRKLKKKEQNPHQILNSQGQKLENRDEILKEYARYYKELLKVRPTENMEKEEIEQTIDKKFKEIIAEGKIVREIITKTEIKKAIKRMENKKAGNKNNSKTECIKEGGSEMVQSLAILFNRVEEENKLPIQWRETKIKSVYKGGNKERIQKF